MSGTGGAGEAPAWLRLIPSVLGAVGLAVLAPFYLASGLMAPAWAVAVFLAVWIGFAVLAIRWFRAKPLWVLALPVIALAFWWGAMSAGEAWLDWTP